MIWSREKFKSKSDGTNFYMPEQHVDISRCMAYFTMRQTDVGIIFSDKMRVLAPDLSRNQKEAISILSEKIHPKGCLVRIL